MLQLKYLRIPGPCPRFGIHNYQAAIQQPRRNLRIAKLMALAIRYDGMLKSGHAADQADLLQITQPRMTQIMNLLHLAPDIQEELLHLPPVDHGRDQIHERMLRPLTSIISWQKQREMWAEMKYDAAITVIQK